MAKQDPLATPAFTASDSSNQLPLFYAGANGAFFGPRAGALGVAYVGRHAFAGLAPPSSSTSSSSASSATTAAIIRSSWVIVETGTLRVTASVSSPGHKSVRQLQKRESLVGL